MRRRGSIASSCCEASRIEGWSVKVSDTMHTQDKSITVLCQFFHLEEKNSKNSTQHNATHAYLEQVHALLVQAGHEARDEQLGPHGEVLVPVLQGGHAGPHVLVGRAKHSVRECKGERSGEFK